MKGRAILHERKGKGGGVGAGECNTTISNLNSRASMTTGSCVCLLCFLIWPSGGKA